MKLLSLIPALLLTACQPAAPPEATAQSRLPDCEWCAAAEAPDDLTASVTIAGEDEPGERLVVTGAVYEADGRTPAPGVLLYAYHTNRAGLYPTRGDETGNARRHGYLRGWLRTDAEGRYEIRTIRPGTYPSRGAPAHIHMTVQPPGDDEYWIDEIVFEDDPLVNESYRAHQDDRGGSGIIRLTRDADGVWHGRRDIVLLR